MPQGTVQAIGTSRSNKPIVTIDGQVYSASKVNLAGMMVGDVIEFDSNSSVYNGATVWFLNSWKATGVHNSPPTHTHRVQANAAPTPSPSPQGGLSEAERIFSYGVVTEAIKAGLVKEPEGIEKWVCAAKNALRNQNQ